MSTLKLTTLALLLLPLLALLNLSAVPASSTHRSKKHILSRLLNPLFRPVHVLQSELGSDRPSRKSAGVDSNSRLAMNAAWRFEYRRKLISKIEPRNDKKFRLPPHPDYRRHHVVATVRVASSVTGVKSRKSGSVTVVKTESMAPFKISVASSVTGVKSRKSARPSGPAQKQQVVKTNSVSLESIAAPAAPAASATTAAVESASKDRPSKITDSSDSEVAVPAQAKIHPARVNVRQSTPAAASTLVPVQSQLPKIPAFRRSVLARAASALASEPSQWSRSAQADRRSMFETKSDVHSPSGVQAEPSVPCPHGAEFPPSPLTCASPLPSACDFAFEGRTNEIPTIFIPSAATEKTLDITASAIVSIVGGTVSDVLEVKGNNSAHVCSAAPGAPAENPSDNFTRLPESVLEIVGPNKLVYNGHLMKNIPSSGGAGAGWDGTDAFCADTSSAEGALVRVQIRSATVDVFGTPTTVSRDALNGAGPASPGGTYLPYERLCLLIRVKRA